MLYHMVKMSTLSGFILPSRFCISMKRAIMLSLVLLGCTEQITFEGITSDKLLVVDGFITDQEGPHLVYLSRSSKFAGELDGGTTERVSNASVQIIDSNSNSETLSEIQAGVYSTSFSFTGTPGIGYQLIIDTEDGNTYTSTVEVLKEAGDIDFVGVDYVSRESINSQGSSFTSMGIEYSINFTFPEDVSYYKWDYEIDFIFLPTVFNEEQDPNAPDTCYVSEDSGEFLKLLENQNPALGSFTSFPIYFMPVDHHFNVMNGINIKQFALSDGATEFWKQVEEQKASTGSIFDPIPSKIIGNIRSVNNASEEVLGYFGAYGEASIRRFVSNDEIAVLLGLEQAYQDDLDICTIVGDRPDYCQFCDRLPNSTKVKPTFWP